MPAPLLLADTPWLLYRGFFALPTSIRGADGAPVNALLGMTNALLRAVEERSPRAVVACFGLETARYRGERYPPYHAHRPPMPPELATQWERAPELCAALGWYVAQSDALEADDLLGSYATVEAASGGFALIVTGDRDMFQAVSPDVHVLLGGNAKTGPDEIDSAQVERRYGIPPALVPDFIALRGDPSDGLPGAKGIGAKSAADLLRRHGSLEAVLDGALRERAVAARALAEQRELLLTFKDVATLRHVDVERPPDRATDRAGGAAAARALGMNALAQRLERAAGAAG